MSTKILFSVKVEKAISDKIRARAKREERTISMTVERIFRNALGLPPSTPEPEDAPDVQTCQEGEKV